MAEVEIHKQGHEYLKELAYSGRKNRFVYDAMIEYGLRMFYVGRLDEGRKMLKSLPACSKGFRELALFYLKVSPSRVGSGVRFISIRS